MDGFPTLRAASVPRPPHGPAAPSIFFYKDILSVQAEDSHWSLFLPERRRGGARQTSGNENISEICWIETAFLTPWLTDPQHQVCLQNVGAGMAILSGKRWRKWLRRRMCLDSTSPTLAVLTYISKFWKKKTRQTCNRFKTSLKFPGALLHTQLLCWLPKALRWHKSSLIILRPWQRFCWMSLIVYF